MRALLVRVCLLLAACALPVAAESEAAPVSQQVVLQPDRELQDTSELLLAVTVIEQRLNAAGISGVRVKAGPGGIHMVLDNLDSEAARQALLLAQERAQLELRLVKPGSIDPLSLVDLEDAAFHAPFIARADLGFDAFTQLHLVSFSIRADQHDAFGEFTESNVGRRLAIVLDGVVLTAPVLQGRITGEGQITGLETLEEANRLASLLHGGVLPFALKLVPNAP